MTFHENQPKVIYTLNWCMHSCGFLRQHEDHEGLHGQLNGAAFHAAAIPGHKAQLERVTTTSN